MSRPGLILWRLAARGRYFLRGAALRPRSSTAIGLTLAALAVSSVAIYLATQPFLATHLTTSFLNERVPPEQQNDTTRPAAMDPLQMVYLTWAAGDALRHRHLLIDDGHQFANHVERFRPLVLDPLVYFGGALSLLLPLALAYNLAQTIVPVVVMALACFGLARVLAVNRAVAFGVALLAPFIPYRLLNSAMGQHNAASVCLLPIFYLCVARALTDECPRRWFAASGLLLLLIGCSEEHLAVATVLFSWPFLVAHAVTSFERHATEPWHRRARAWIRELATEGWPMLPFVAALVPIVLFERAQLLQHSIVRHVYGFDVVQMYSVEFNDSYFHRTVGYHLLLMPLAVAGIILVARGLRRKDMPTALRQTRFAFALVFLSSAFLCLGDVPVLTAALHFDPYRFFFDHIPLFKMQRYPHRLCYAAYASGLVLVACALDAPLRAIASPRRAGAVEAVVVAAFAIAAVNWARLAPPSAFFDIAHDPNRGVHDAIRRTAGHDRIVLAIPAHNGSMWSDSRVLLSIIFTGGRFFNGYWSSVPTIYWNLIGSIIRFGDSGVLPGDLLSELRRIGVEFLLVDKTAVRTAAFTTVRQSPVLQIVYEDSSVAYFALARDASQWN